MEPQKAKAIKYIDTEINKAKTIIQEKEIAKTKINSIELDKYYEICLQATTVSGKIENYIVKPKVIGGERCKFKIVAAESIPPSFIVEKNVLRSINNLAWNTTDPNFSGLHTNGSLNLIWHHPWKIKPWNIKDILLYISWEYKSNEFIGWLKNPNKGTQS